MQNKKKTPFDAVYCMSEQMALLFHVQGCDITDSGYMI